MIALLLLLFQSVITPQPTFSLASGSYNFSTAAQWETTISLPEPFTGEPIEYCLSSTSSCTPNVAYANSTKINVEPSATQPLITVCANALAPGLSRSATTCNHYTVVQVWTSGCDPRFNQGGIGSDGLCHATISIPGNVYNKLSCTPLVANPKNKNILQTTCSYAPKVAAK